MSIFKRLIDLKRYARRTFHVVAGLIIVGGLAVGSYAPVSEREGFSEQEHLAFNTLRLIATVQARALNSSGKYVSLADMEVNPHLRELESDEVAEARGVGATLIGQVDWQGDYIIPEFRAQSWLSEDAAEYSVVLYPQDKPAGRAFSIDERTAKIYVGSVDSGLSNAQAFRSDAVLVDAQSPCVKQASFSMAQLWSTMTFSSEVLADCSASGTCGCYGLCCNTAECRLAVADCGATWTHLGCGECPWCCMGEDALPDCSVF